MLAFAGDQDPEKRVSEEPLGELLRATARGDESAFARLYERTAPVLMAVCLRILRRRDRAEDALQEAYVRIWRKSHLYDPAVGEPFAWLVVVTRRCALSALRHQGPTPAGLDEVPTEPSFVPSFERTELGRCLARLPDGPRRALILAYVDGLTHAELALRMGVPLGTAKSWVRRGLMAMRDVLVS